MANQTNVTSELREQTGADKIYILNNCGKTIILPVHKGYNIFCEKYAHLPEYNEYVLSNKHMIDEFIPGLKKHLTEKGMPKENINEIIQNLFEKQRYLGHSWHRRELRVHKDYPSATEETVWLTGDGTKKSFYGSARAGNILSSITNIDDFLKN